MKLRHFSRLPVLTVYDVEQVNPEPMRHYTKPIGLWVSDESDEEASWSKWCASEQYGIAPLEHFVDLAPDANILRVNSVGELDAFAAKYGVCSDHRYFRDEPAIQWADVARDFDGIIITPYLWPRRLSQGSSWYYGWDCASGCIWRGRAITRIEPSAPPRIAADLIEAAST